MYPDLQNAIAKTIKWIYFDILFFKQEGILANKTYEFVIEPQIDLIQLNKESEVSSEENLPN